MIMKKISQLLIILFAAGIFAVAGITFVRAANTPSGEVYSNTAGATAGPTLESTTATPASVALGGSVVISVKTTDVSGISVATANIRRDNGGTIAIIQLYDDGKHSDGTAGDDVYANTWNTGANGNGLYLVDIQLADALGHPTVSTAAATITVGTGNSNANFNINTTTSDTTAPTVSITVPTNGASVTGTTSINATAADTVGVSGVQFKIDNLNLGAEDASAPYSVSWDTTATASGSHALTAVARDAAGNSTTSTAVTVTVSNTTPDTTAPEVSITAPATDGTVLSTASYSVVANATDPESAIIKVEFYLDLESMPRDTQIYDQPLGSHNYTWVLNVGSLTNGSHTLKAIAYNGASLTTTATRTVNVTVPPSAPTVTINQPTNGAYYTSTGTLSYSISATDDVALTKVDLFSSGGGGPLASTVASTPAVTFTGTLNVSQVTFLQSPIKSYAMVKSGLRLPFVKTARAVELSALDCPTGTHEVCTDIISTTPKGLYAVAYDATSSTTSAITTINVTTVTGQNCSCQIDIAQDTSSPAL